VTMARIWQDWLKGPPTRWLPPHPPLSTGH